MSVSKYCMLNVTNISVLFMISGSWKNIADFRSRFKLWWIIHRYLIRTSDPLKINNRIHYTSSIEHFNNRNFITIANANTNLARSLSECVIFAQLFFNPIIVKMHIAYHYRRLSKLFPVDSLYFLSFIKKILTLFFGTLFGAAGAKYLHR